MKGERLAGDWLDLLVGMRDGTDNDYGADRVSGVLGTFARDCLCPPKDAILWACAYCREYIKPGCPTGWYHQGRSRACHREALLRELEDAYTEMQGTETGYGLSLDLSWEEYLERMESPLRDPEWIRKGRVGEVVKDMV